MKAFCLSGALLLGLFCGCSAEPETRITAEQDLSERAGNSGVIIDKQDGRVLLVSSAEKQDILNGAVDSILAVDASFPAQTEAVRIEGVTPADWTEEERARLE